MSDLTYANLATIATLVNNINDKFATKSQLDNIEFPVTSVNGQTGDVVIDAAEQAQGDWNENSEESPSFIKNRTHYISINRIDALPEQTFDTGTNGYVDLYDVELNGLTPDCQCIVTINGNEYRTTAIHNVYNAYEWYIIGNGELLDEAGGDSSAPFGFFIDKYNENWGVLDGITGNATIKIEVFSEVVKKIPEIFLPEKVGLPGTGSYSEIFNNLTKNTATGDYSHAENFDVAASGYASHGEGIGTKANGYGSHAEGNGSEAKGSYSHAEGWATLASGAASHAGGIGTIAAGQSQTVIGEYNVQDTTSLFIIGNGDSSGVRQNAFTVHSSGEVKAAGDIIARSHSNTEEDVSLIDVYNKTKALESSMSELKIEEIKTEDIQALFSSNA